MKGSNVKQLALALALLLAGSSAGALEVGMEFGSTNLQFPWAWTEPLPDATDSFPWDNFFWGGKAWISEAITEDSAFRLSYERDPVLRNTVAAAIEFERGLTRISVGPRLGLFNSSAIPVSAGLSSSVRLQWPGVAYVSMRSDGGLAVGVLASGADPQAMVELAAGVYARNAIVSAVVEAKRFNDIDDAGAVASTDSWTKYALEVDVFKKNVPYTFLGSVGYEVRSKRYAASDATDSLGAVVMGVSSDISLGRAIKLGLGLDSGFYVFGMDGLRGQSPSTSSFMFAARAGLTFDVDGLTAAYEEARAAREAVAMEKAAAEAAAAAAEPEAPSEEGPPAAPAAETPAQEAPAPEPPAAEPSVAEEPAAAAEAPKALDLRAGGGIYYNIAPLPEGPFALLAAIYNLRGGVWAGIEWLPSPAFGVGGEVGLQYIYSSSADGSSSLSIFDLPLRGTATYRLGSLALTAFAGLFSSGSIGSGSPLDLGFGLEGGARLALGSFYAEGSYVLGLGEAASYPRAGLGFMMPFDKLFKKD